MSVRLRRTAGRGRPAQAWGPYPTGGRKAGALSQEQLGGGSVDYEAGAAGEAEGGSEHVRPIPFGAEFADPEEAVDGSVGEESDDF